MRTRSNRKKNAPTRFAPVACALLAAALVSALAWSVPARGDAGSEEANGDDSARPVTVGFVTGHGEPAPDGLLSGVAEVLRRSRAVLEVRLEDGAVSVDGIDVVVVAGSPDIPDVELYVLDQFLMRGGRLAFLLDAAVIPETGTQSNLSEANIFGFLSTYGLTVNPDLVLDDVCATGASWGRVVTSSAYPYWPVVRGSGIAGEHPAVSGLTAVPMAWTSSITARNTGSGTARMSALLRSSPDSRTVSAFTDIDPERAFEPPSDYDDVSRVAGADGFALAVAAEGTFRSAFTGQQIIVQRGKEVEFVEPEGMIVTSAPAKVAVFGSSMMFRDDLAGQLAGNAELLAGVVDWLASDSTEEDESAGATGSTPTADWTPRKFGFVVLALAVLAAAVATAAVSRRKRRSSTT